ncbi:MAG: hypothetical protein ABIS84_08630 [Arachnia sp.]
MTELPTPTAPQTTSDQATAAANPSPSLVWGREDSKRQSVEPTRNDKPAPWSQMAAVAGAAFVVGGLGTAFARGLQTSVPPVVEDE